MNPSNPLANATLNTTIVALCPTQDATNLLLIQVRAALTSAPITGPIDIRSCTDAALNQNT